MGLVPACSPQGRLYAEDRADESAVDDARLADRLREAFASSAGHGLLALVRADPAPLHAPFRWLRDLGNAYLTRLCHVPDLDAQPWSVPPPDAAGLASLVQAAPPFRGLEYVTTDVLARVWLELDGAVRDAMRAYAGPPQAFLESIHPDWRLVGRVTFHLAENPRNPEKPFAFLATYTAKMAATAKPQYTPLERALTEYAGQDRRDALLSLLLPVQRAATHSAFVKQLVDSGSIYRPLAWTPQEAYRFLRDLPLCEQAGVLVRVPDWWRGGRPSRPMVSVEIGTRPASGLGFNSMLDFSARVALDGEELTAEEWKKILESAQGLVQLRGRWVEIDREQLEQALQHFRKVARYAEEGVNFAEAMRLLAGGGTGMAGGIAGLPESAAGWVGVQAGPWLAETLAALRDPAKLATALPLDGLRAELRPYQQAGVQWLWFMTRLGLGACLADDMGLGKTLQLIALLLALKHVRESGSEKNGGASSASPRPMDQVPSLLVAPASLLANWMSEIERFAPSLKARVLHPSAMEPAELDACRRNDGGTDLFITTYGMVARLPWLAERKWRVLAIDEAQAIKNPAARQTRTVKELDAEHRIALTGTPVENRLSDLWSLFDFLNPGLLGSAAQFDAYARRLDGASGTAFAPLRALVRPYILRRLKTDKTVIADLPDKTEVNAYCALVPDQAALYQRAVRDLAADLKQEEDPIRRKGLVLAYLLRFKQICNHPSHWLGDGVYAPDGSGKFERLRELVADLIERQERALVFTQFRELTAPLAEFLARLYGRPGLVLHGGTPVAQRRKLVEEFQRDDGPPFFVLSLKAGGTGLNLTAAAQVIHFDRWWNPAVENQATDRAFRIGQKKNVLVHKFVCRGTLEERIDKLIASKRELADTLLGGGAEKVLTDMNNDELLRFVALDLPTATA